MKNTVLFTFLGAYPNEPTNYIYLRKEFHSIFSSVAIANFLKIDKIIVFLTEGAKENNLSEFKKRLPNYNITEILIKEGINEAELWDLFDQISETIRLYSDHKIIFDITHGFRLHPAVTILASVFLKSGLGIEIEKLLYGAYIRGNDDTQILDLTPMLSLLDWSTAADIFTRTGDSRDIAGILQNITSNKELAKLSNQLTNVSNSLLFFRPQEAINDISSLDKSIELVLKKQRIESKPELKPFELLLENIRHSYKKLAFHNLINDEILCNNLEYSSLETLQKEKDLIFWYADKNLWASCVSLMREWLISWVMIHENIYDYNNFNKRETIIKSINDELKLYKNFYDKKFNKFDYEKYYITGPKKYKLQLFSENTNLKNIILFYKFVRGFRNEVVHVNKESSTSEIQKNINKSLEIFKSVELPKNN